VHSEVGHRGAAEESWRDRDRGGRDGALDVLGREVMEGPWSTEISYVQSRTVQDAALLLAG
jgi:cell cycle checkpoint protein